jgi:hypothetical protein
VDATREQQEAADTIRGPRTPATGNPIVPGGTGSGSTGGQGGSSSGTGGGRGTGGGVRQPGAAGSTQSPDGTGEGSGTGGGTGPLGDSNTADGREPGTDDVSEDRDEGGEGTDRDTGSGGTTRTDDDGSVVDSTGTGGKRRVIASEGQSHYEPVSKSGQIGSLVPSNMAQPLKEALERLAMEYGSVDQFVLDELQYASMKELYKAFSAEQVDAIALAIDNLQNNNGFILGVQTEIGKGRVVAALIKHTIINNKSPGLYIQLTNLSTALQAYAFLLR